MRTASAAASASLKQACSNLVAPTARRSFATSNSMLKSYGFIGLGRMGRRDMNEPPRTRLKTFRLPNGHESPVQDRRVRHADSV